jgi:IPT/TIG domain
VHEVDRVLQAAVYTTKEGWTSNLLLLNAEGKAVTARVTLYDKHGRSLNISPITLEAYTSRSWNIADWVRNANGFEEGSVTVTYFGLAMGLHAQETVSNKQRSLSFDVHLEDTMELMSPTVDGLWWGLDARSEAKVFIANTRATQTTVTPIFYVAGAGHQGEAIILDPHGSSAIDIGKALKQLHVPATLGGISLLSSDGSGAISAIGVISNKHNGFSTTMRFIDHHMAEATNSLHSAHNMSGTTTSLHGANILIGKSSANPGFRSSTRFTPHVIVRNTSSEVVKANGRIRFTLFDQPNVSELAPVELAANEVRELDMSSVIDFIGDNSVNAGIEIDYSGQPGALMVYSTSIDQSGTNAFDVPIKDPTAMAFKGGANPWKIDDQNRAVLHVKNVNAPDGEKHAFIVSLYYDGGVYNLPVQLLEAGQTTEIDIKKLRDNRIADGSGNVIPLNVTRGQLSWYPKAENDNFIGRLVQYDPEGGTSSSFSCAEPCWCSYDHFSSFVVPGSFTGHPGDFFQVNAYEILLDCYGWPHGPYHITYATFFTDSPFVADVFYQNQNAYVVLLGGGSADITATWTTYFTVGQDCDQWDWASGWCEVPNCTYEQVATDAQTQVTSQGPPHIDSITPSRGVEDATTRVTISGTGFAAGATVNPGSGATASIVSISPSTIVADFAVAGGLNAVDGPVNVTVTANGQTSNNDKTFFHQVARHVVPLDHQLAPNGIAPLQVVVDGNLLALGGQVAIGPHFCGIGRNYLFKLTDQENQEITNRPFILDEVFSNYTGSWSIPTFTPLTFPPGSQIADLLSRGVVGEGCTQIQSGMTETFTQGFQIRFGNTVFLLDTLIQHSRGNFGGELRVDRTITTP